jgi:glutamate--cysteine ligase
MGNLGYKSEAQKSLFVCYNDLDSYAQCLETAMHTPYPDYESIGQKRDGEYVQLNTNLLQLENEFYSTVRPKRVAISGERPLDALISKGIEYIEVRALDLNPYLPLGIDAQQIRFLDSFLVHCLLDKSPECNQTEFFEVAKNLASVVEHGRNPDLELSLESKPRKLVEWANELLENISFSSALLDGENSDLHEQSRLAQIAKVENPDLTPSGRMLKDMQEKGMSFFEFSMNQSEIQKQTLTNGELSAETAELMHKTAVDSIAKLAEIEAADAATKIGFDEYLAKWNES